MITVPSNLLLVLGVLMVAAGTVWLAVQVRAYRRPPEPPPVDPYTEPGSLFIPHDPERMV